MTNTETIRPFARQGYQISVDTYIWDVIMPMVSGSEWKILSFILRKTTGWHKEFDELSISQIQKGTGLKSQTTVINGCSNLADQKLIVKISGNRGKNESSTYGLNKDYEITTETKQQKPTTKNGVGSDPTPKNGSRQLQKMDIQDVNNNIQDSNTSNTNVLDSAPSASDDAIDPNDYTVKEFEDLSFTTEQYKQLLEREKAGQNRKGIKNHIVRKLEFASFSEPYQMYCREMGISGNHYKKTETGQSGSFHQEADREEFRIVTDLDFFKQVLLGWRRKGYHERNIDGILNCYKERKIPNGNGHSNSRSNGSSPIKRSETRRPDEITGEAYKEQKFEY